MKSKEKPRNVKLVRRKFKKTRNFLRWTVKSFITKWKQVWHNADTTKVRPN